MKNNKVFIIAEAGVNHNGDIGLAKKIIEAAHKSGADAVKFQIFKAENLVCRNAAKAAYQKSHSAKYESQFAMLKKLELPDHAWKILIKHCKNNKIMFLASPFDLESLSILSKLGIGIIKIPSGEITNKSYLVKAGKMKKKIIMSTGMADIREIEWALKILIRCGTPKNNIILLHCNTAYPTPYSDVHLNVMQKLKEEFGVNVGYSDHTEGIEVSLAAVALGAAVIEKHFTLDRNMAGPDHKASLMPDEFARMASSIRNIEAVLGKSSKKPTPSEIKNIAAVRKSIVAAEYIKAGETFTNMNITVKRPGNGISAAKWDYVLGKKAGRNFLKDDLIILK